MVLGTAGDRTDEAIHAMGAMAAQAADRLVVAGKDQVPAGPARRARWRQIWRAGAAEAGVVRRRRVTRRTGRADPACWTPHRRCRTAR